MSYIRAIAVRVGLALVGLLVASDAASADELKDSLTGLLDIGWQSSVKSYEEAQRRYVRLAEAFPSEVRVPFAMAMVAIKHRRYSSALERIDEMLALKPQLWIGQRTRLWLLVVLQRNEAALEAAAVMCEQIAGEELDPAQRSTRLHWIGRLFAYIEAPTGVEVAPTMIKRYEDRVLAALNDTDQQTFDEGRDSLMTAFSANQFEHQQVKAEEKVVEAGEKVQKQEELKVEKDETLAAADNAEQQAASLRNDLDTNLTQIDEQITSVQSQFAAAASRANSARAVLDQISINIGAVQLQYDSTPPDNIFERNRLLAILQSLDFDYARQAAIFRPLAAQAAALQNELAGLNNQRQQLVAEFEAQIKQLGRMLTGLQRRALRINSDERKLAKTDPMGNTPRARAKDLVITALTTYEPFPVEQEKQTILRSLK